MNVYQVKTAAIVENFNDPGSATSFVTPTMYSRWINEAVKEIWRILTAINPELYSFQERTISLVSGTESYDLSSDVISISDMAIRSGSSGAYNYSPIYHLNNKRKTFPTKVGGAFWGPMLGTSKYMWVEDGSALTDTGSSVYKFVRKIKILPTPTSSETLVYNGQRMPVDIDVPPADETTEFIDLPEDQFEHLCRRVEKKAMQRDQQDCRDINQQILELEMALRLTYMKGLNRQTNSYIERT